jgi:hypothetical protein
MRDIFLTAVIVAERVKAARSKLKRLIPRPDCFGAQSIQIDMPEHGLHGVLGCKGLEAEIWDARLGGRRPGTLSLRWYYHEPVGCNGVLVEDQVFASGAWDYGGMADGMDFGLNVTDQQLDWEAILLTLGKPAQLGKRISQNTKKQVPFGLWRDKCGHEFTTLLDESFLDDPRVASVPSFTR